MAGQPERAVETVRNDSSAPDDVTLWFTLQTPCGIIWGDPTVRTVPPNGGIAKWRFKLPTQKGCVGRYVFTVQLRDPSGRDHDKGTFKATA
jgi:hypothetical protein